MKTLRTFVPLAALLFASCGGEQKPAANTETTTVAITPEDQELLKLAQTYFQPLPVDASTPEHTLTPEKIALGKVLYFDTRLSKTGKQSCNTCHNLSTFGVDNQVTSEGDAGKRGARNSPTSLNAALHFAQFWDGRAKDVEEQAGMPILNPVEMNIPSREFLEKRLREIQLYQTLFAAAFPESKQPITFANLETAIGAFERTLMTPSKFDAYLKGDIQAMSAEERAGLQEFISSGCTTCHIGPAVGGTMYQKFGLVADYRPLTGSTGKDMGRMDITKSSFDKDMFKVPSLRNITGTQPYFHDGSVSDLSKAIHIMAKVELNKDLSDEQIARILTFLEALTGEVPEEVKKVPGELVGS